MKVFTVSNDSGSDVTINDLGAIVIPDETVNLNLSPSNFKLERIRDSDDLKAAIEAGSLTAIFDGVAITSQALFEQYIEDFNQNEIVAIEGVKTITHNVGAIQATINQDLERTKEGTTTAETPYDTPFLPTSYLKDAIITSKKDDNETYDIKVLINDAVVKTFAITADDGIIERGITGISATTGQKIRYRIEKHGVTAFDVRKLECEFVWTNRA